MTKRDWLILLLAYKGDRGSALDPVRIQKGMFLLSRQGLIPDEQQYEFEPYHYGPYSFELRKDADQLVRQDLAEKLSVTGYTWGRYRLTDEGVQYATQLINEVGLDAARKVYEMKQDVTGKNFASLLRDVYSRYPDFARNSVFTG